jgi:hypothetical protein
MSHVVESTTKKLLGSLRLSSPDAKRDCGRYCLRLVLEALEQLFCLIEAALEHTNLCEARGRMRAARTLARLGELPDRCE